MPTLNVSPQLKAEWSELAAEVSKAGGRPAGKLLWLYSDMLGGRDRAAVTSMYEQLSTGLYDIAEPRKEMEWCAWLEDRIGTVMDRVVDDGVMNAALEAELRGLQRIYLWLQSRAGDWGGVSLEGRARHTERCYARARVFELASQLRTRYGGDRELLTLDRRICRHVAGAYYRLGCEWSGVGFTRAGLRAWFDREMAGVLSAGERSAARDWDWSKDVPDAIDLLDKLATRMSGRAHNLVTSEIECLRGALRDWEAGGGQ